MREQPSLILSFYTFGVMLRKQDGERISEYPVDPAQIATVLSTKVRFDTGLLTEDALFIRYEGIKKIVVEYRPPQKTGLYLDGSENALRTPFPGLVMIRTTIEDKRPEYQIYAVKKRPTTLATTLFHAPLPNIYDHGGVCWGTVKNVSEAGLKGTSLAEDWKVLLGSPFGGHAVGGKSKSHPQDVLKLMVELEARKARVYPNNDLLSTRKTLEQVIGVER
jgi:hypothetical protein